MLIGREGIIDDTKPLNQAEIRKEEQVQSGETNNNPTELYYIKPPAEVYEQYENITDPNFSISLFKEEDTKETKLKKLKMLRSLAKEIKAV